MDRGVQQKLAKEVKLSEGFISLVLKGIRRPSWSTAKRLAFATNTTPYLWLEGTSAEIKRELEKNIEHIKTTNH